MERGALCPVCFGDGEFSSPESHIVELRKHSVILAENLLYTVVDCSHAELATIQLFDAPSGTLKLVAHRGFGPGFLDFFDIVRGQDCACGAAMRKHSRVVVPDVGTDKIFRGKESREVMLSAGARAVQSTPLVSATGSLLGVVSTHARRAGRPAARHIQTVDAVVSRFTPHLEHATGY